MEYKTDEQPIAVMGLTNSGGIAIFEIVYGIDDYVRYKYFNGEGYEPKMHKATIDHTNKGAYFMAGGSRFYILSFNSLSY